MHIYATICLMSAVAVLLAMLNAKYGRTQSTIAITAFALIVSLLIAFSKNLGISTLEDSAVEIINSIHFGDFLLKGVLGFLLFAGAMGIHLPALRKQKWEITSLALVATIISTLIIGFATWGIFQLLGINLALIYCLLFGALISPTDPIAVLAIIRQLKAPEQVAIQVEGESLFNDGIGLVIFTTIFAVAFNGTAATFSDVSLLFLQEAVGGVLYGIALGYLFHVLISSTDDHSLEILLTFGVPTAGYVVAELLHVSGPLAMVASGIIIGNWTRETGFSAASKEHLDHFWELVDEFLNNLLFLLIGLSLLVFSFHQEDWLVAAIAIPVTLAARYLSVKLCYLGFERLRSYNPLSVKILTWGGLRGGLALAMAMSIPSGVMVMPEKNIDVRELIVVMTYAVVMFSILVQGSTISSMITKAKSYDAQLNTNQQS